MSLSEVPVLPEQAFDENELPDDPAYRFDCHFWCVAEVVGQSEVGGEGRFNAAAEARLDESMAERISELS